MASKNKVISTTSSSKRLFTTVASVAASTMLVRSVVNEILPYELRDYVFSGLTNLRTYLSSQLTIVIHDKEGFAPNHIYEASRIYLATKISSTSTRRLRVSKQDDQKSSFSVCIEPGEEILDVFKQVQFKWKSIHQEKQRIMAPLNTFPPTSSEDWYFELSFHEKHKDMALRLYLPHVIETAKSIKEGDKTLKLYLNERDSWNPINLHHPATFDTLAMDPDLKRTIMEDLSRFVKRKDYYRKIGKAWKRGYLLHGPPGTGKSSLVAAMANYLNFDIYNLELNKVQWNAALQCLLVGMANRSILVIEDIDCSIPMENRDTTRSANINGRGRPSPNDKVTLSGLLNFVDGLWSSCGEERIIVFTTNYKDRLDSALLRPGRMDMHVYMGYCSPHAFRVLASNYHGVDDHQLFPKIEELMQEVEVTPAEVAEKLMRSDDADVALQGLLEFMVEKRERRPDEKEGGEADRVQEGLEENYSEDNDADADAEQTADLNGGNTRCAPEYYYMRGRGGLIRVTRGGCRRR